MHTTKIYMLKFEIICLFPIALDRIDKTSTVAGYGLNPHYAPFYPPPKATVVALLLFLTCFVCSYRATAQKDSSTSFFEEEFMPVQTPLDDPSSSLYQDPCTRSQRISITQVDFASFTRLTISVDQYDDLPLSLKNTLTSAMRPIRIADGEASIDVNPGNYEIIGPDLCSNITCLKKSRHFTYKKLAYKKYLQNCTDQLRIFNVPKSAKIFFNTSWMIRP